MSWSKRCTYVDFSSACNIKNQLDIGVVVVVGTALNLHILIGQSDVLCVHKSHITDTGNYSTAVIKGHVDILWCKTNTSKRNKRIFTSICFQVLGRYHDDEAYSVFILEHLIRPTSDGSHAFHSSDAIVGYENLITNKLFL